MRKAVRYAFLAISAVFAVGIVAQVFFAGWMLFGQEGGADLHRTTGWILHTVSYTFVLIPALARAGRKTIVLGLVLAVITFVQPLLPEARGASPLIAALHPVNALFIFTLALILTRRALLLVREERTGLAPAA